MLHPRPSHGAGRSCPQRQQQRNQPQKDTGKSQRGVRPSASTDPFIHAASPAVGLRGLSSVPTSGWGARSHVLTRRGSDGAPSSVPMAAPRVGDPQPRVPSVMGWWQTPKPRCVLPCASRAPRSFCGRAALGSDGAERERFCPPLPLLWHFLSCLFCLFDFGWGFLGVFFLFFFFFFGGGFWFS